MNAVRGSIASLLRRLRSTRCGILPSHHRLDETLQLVGHLSAESLLDVGAKLLRQTPHSSRVHGVLESEVPIPFVPRVSARGGETPQARRWKRAGGVTTLLMWYPISFGVERLRSPRFLHPNPNSNVVSSFYCFSALYHPMPSSSGKRSGAHCGVPIVLPSTTFTGKSQNVSGTTTPLGSMNSTTSICGAVLSMTA